MTIKTIEDDIVRFNDDFFAKNYGLIEFNNDFIQIHNLYQPKQNYLLTLKFLNVIIHHFRQIDFSFFHATLKKLHGDIHNLHKVYLKTKENEQNVEKIFEKNFLYESEFFQDMRNALIELQKPVMLDEFECESKETLNQHYKEMKSVYYKYFVDMFLEENKAVVSELAFILNTKLYYLDKLLWLYVAKSELIMRSLQTQNLTQNIDSKKYLKYRLSIALPHVENVQYMQQCLRIYK